MGALDQIFRVILAEETLTDLALSYVRSAALCKMHGDNRGFERFLDRAQDAYAAARLITDGRPAQNAPEIIDVFPVVSFSAESENASVDYVAKYLNKAPVDHGGAAWQRKPNAITARAELLLAVPCLPAPRKSILAELVAASGQPLAWDYFDTFAEAHAWGCDKIGGMDSVVLRIRAAMATDYPLYPVL